MDFLQIYLFKKTKFILNFLIILFFFIISTQILFSEISKKEIKIKKKNAEFDQNLGVISLNINVVLKIDKITFKSDKMKLFFEDNTPIYDDFSRLTKIVASGNVFFERDKEIIKSDLVSFFPKENKVEIKGNVKIIKGENVGFKSDILEINLKEKF